MDLSKITKETGIYCFENKANGKKYIGRSINSLRRVKSHLNELRLNKDECSYFQNAWNKYGEENFIVYVLEYCDIETLSERETFYIKEYNTKRPNGYNLNDGGDGNVGYKPTEETLLKLSISHLGKVLSEKSKSILSILNSGDKNPFYNRKHSDESRKKISEKGRGRKASEKTLKKKSESMMGNKNHLFGKKLTNSTSQYLGVSFSDNRYWTIQIRKEGNLFYLGKYKVEKDSGVGFDIGNVFFYGVDCNLNFPELRENYISYLNQYDIQDIKQLRQVIKNYINDLEEGR